MTVPATNKMMTQIEDAIAEGITTDIFLLIQSSSSSNCCSKLIDEAFCYIDVLQAAK